MAQLPQARLVNQLLGILRPADLHAVECTLAMTDMTFAARYYENFEIDDTTGKPLSRREVTDLHYERLQLLQRAT